MVKAVSDMDIGIGEFPFPINDGPDESGYLTWIRNHSNYMAVRGVFDYLRAISVLLRGIFINFLVLLPYLMLVSLVVAAWYLFLTPSFKFTIGTLIGGAICVLLFPLATPLFKIMRHKRRLETGSDSSVKLRDRYERLFGGILLLVIAVAAFESLSYFLDDFHRIVHAGGIGGLELTSIGAIAIALFTGADKLLTILGGITRKLAIIVIGALGLLVPLVVVLILADFLVYSPPSLTWSNWMFIAVAVLIFVILLAVLIGLVFRSFTGKDTLKAVGLLLAMLLIASAVLLGDENAWSRLSDYQQKLDAVLSTETRADMRPTERQEMNKLIDDAATEPGPRMETLFERATSTRAYLAPTRGQFRNAAAAFKEGSILATLSGYGEYIPDAGYLAHEIQGLNVEQLDSLEVHLKELIARMDALPLQALHDSENNVELVRTVLGIPLENLQHFSLAYFFGQAGAEHADHPESLAANETILSVERTLDEVQEVLLAAREELAITANYSRMQYPLLYASQSAKDARRTGFVTHAMFLLMFVGPLWLLSWLTVDINLTSIHGLYRDRLASAFLVRENRRHNVDIERDLDLAELCRHEAGSTAPYHLINVALNLQGSKDIGVRDRKSDFFIFSKKFTGGERTRYCRSETMELIFPQMGLSTAMAISAAAASPNMGRGTSPALVAIMTLLNIRLGYWLPNPGRLESWLWKHKGDGGKKGGYSFDEVFADELIDVTHRWEQSSQSAGRKLSASPEHHNRPSTAHNLVGIAYSGGGIRSATINLGITQALHRRGVFDHVDYMSTVSGGGYLGSSISALMRRKTRTISEIGGAAKLSTNGDGEKIVTVAPPKRSKLMSKVLHTPQNPRNYSYADYADIAVEDGRKVKAGQRLINVGLPPNSGQNSLSNLFHWRVRPGALLREMAGRLDENHRWVNVSDGGHIENLATIELLRRRCKYIIVGDGEADPQHHFNGLATLIRSARIDLGVNIEIDLDALRLGKDQLTKGHWAIGTIDYPDESEPGYLLYLKSSVSGDEDEVIQEYRHCSASFPHESTADQFFDEGQFEAYRSLGQHIAEQALGQSAIPLEKREKMSFADFRSWFEALSNK